MDYDEFASDLAPFRTATFIAVEETEEALGQFGIYQPMRQLGAGTYRCDMGVMSSEHAELFSERFNKALSVLIVPPAGTVALLFPRSASGQFRASGGEVGNDKLLVVPDGFAIDIVIPDLSGGEGIFIAEERFAEMIEAVCPTPKSVRPDRMATIAGNTSQLHALRTEVLGLIAHPEGSSPERLTNVLAETIAWMGQTGSRWRPERLIGNGTRRRVAKLAQEFIEEHHCEVVQAEDLCRATGVGLRTVQRCFMNYFGLTYSSYLKTVRLDAARRDLLAADASHESVTTIAQRHGIRHRGRFSVDFRERFGVSPAETLNTRAVVKLKLDTSPRV